MQIRREAIPLLVIGVAIVCAGVCGLGAWRIYRAWSTERAVQMLIRQGAFVLPNEAKVLRIEWTAPYSCVAILEMPQMRLDQFLVQSKLRALRDVPASRTPAGTYANDPEWWRERPVPMPAREGGVPGTGGYLKLYFDFDENDDVVTVFLRWIDALAPRRAGSLI